MSDGASDGGDTAELARRAQAAAKRGEDVYRCQATELGAASEAFPADDRGRKYLREVQSGNVGVARFLRVLVRAVRRNAARTLGLHRDIALWSEGKPPPSTPLGLQPGELVRVRSKRKGGRRPVGVPDDCPRAVPRDGHDPAVAAPGEPIVGAGHTRRQKSRTAAAFDGSPIGSGDKGDFKLKHQFGFSIVIAAVNPDWGARSQTSL